MNNYRVRRPRPLMHCARMTLALGFCLLLLGNAGAELGVDWVKVEDTPRFSPRRYHTAVVHQDKIWVIGGVSNGERKNDVWSSPDGVNWTLVTEAAPFTPRFAHQSVVYQDKIWVIGGDDGARPVKNEVWSTTDGVNWTNVNGGPAFFQRRHFAMTVHDGKMWIVGGDSFQGHMLNDVWWSVNGNVWHLATRGAPFSRRWGHHVVAHDGKFWLIGGFDYTYQNDIWVSDDGAHWEQVLGGPIFFARRHAAAVAFDGKIWMIGGIYGDSQIGTSFSIGPKFAYYPQDDVWNSIDGITWNRTVLHAAFRPVGRAASVVFDDKIWLIGGSVQDPNLSDNDINEIWFSEAGTSSASSPDVWPVLE